MEEQKAVSNGASSDEFTKLQLELDKESQALSDL